MRLLCVMSLSYNDNDDTYKGAHGTKDNCNDQSNFDKI